MLALAADLRRRGGAVHEDTRVDGSEGQPCVLTTDIGVSIRADEVVIATHYPVFDRAPFFARLPPGRELVMAGTVEETLAPRRHVHHARAGHAVGSQHTVRRRQTPADRHRGARRPPVPPTSRNASPDCPPAHRTASPVSHSRTAEPARTTTPPTPCPSPAHSTPTAARPTWPLASAGGD
ncbi:hypothetical protein ACFWP7_32180 [Streptomyces sp. NPDC058470]|uniref:hypothetical protein n=1 Tax=Streptomyces sp. NPDC058470 TaxID=3346515 RepID=UPI003650E34C